MWGARNVSLLSTLPTLLILYKVEAVLIFTTKNSEECQEKQILKTSLLPLGEHKKRQ
jgi:hypothetical protein